MATKRGTAAEDALAGDDEPDLLEGRAGSDLLLGGDGNDTLFNHFEGNPFSGSNNDGARDILDGGEGNDWLYVASLDAAHGESGNDTFVVGPGGAAPAILDGGAGVDTLVLADGIGITGTPVGQLLGLEILRAEDGSHGVTPSLTAAQLGAFGSIRPFSGKSEVLLNLTGGGTAVLNPVGVSTLTIWGSVQGEILNATATSTRLVYRGNTGQFVGDAEVRSGSADDDLVGYTGTDRLYGGAGLDKLYNHFDSNPNSGSNNDGAPDFLYGQGGNDQLFVASLDEARGGGGDDVIFVGPGGPAPAILNGGAGNDVLVLEDADDITGTGGNLVGLEVLLADDGSSGPKARLTADQLGHFDRIEAFADQSDVHLTLTGDGAARLNPSSDVATLIIDGSAAGERLNADGAAGILDYRGGIGDAVVRGGEAGDRLHGNDGSDMLYGGAGADRLFNHLENPWTDGVRDVLHGGAGNDSLHVATLDEAYGGPDNDRIIVGPGGAPAILDGGPGNDALELGDGIDITGAQLFGLEALLADDGGSAVTPRLTAAQLGQFVFIKPFAGQSGVHLTLTGGGTALFLDASHAVATFTIDGSAEDETLAMDTITPDTDIGLIYRGGSGRGDIRGGDGADDLRGGGGGDTLTGAGGADELRGQDGNDILTGGAGADRLYGGARADNFHFVSVAESGASATTRDRIADFVQGKDVIDISFIDAMSGAAGNNEFTFIGSAHFTAEGQVRAFQSGDSTIVAMNVTGAIGAESTIELEGLFTLTASDFFL